LSKKFCFFELKENMLLTMPHPMAPIVEAKTPRIFIETRDVFIHFGKFFGFTPQTSTKKYIYPRGNIGVYKLRLKQIRDASKKKNTPKYGHLVRSGWVRSKSGTTTGKQSMSSF